MQPKVPFAAANHLVILVHVVLMSASHVMPIPVVVYTYILRTSNRVRTRCKMSGMGISFFH